MMGNLEDELKQHDFYHIIELPNGLKTPGRAHFKYMWDIVIESLEKIDFRGKRVLDVGCRDGLFSFFAEERGAAEVIAIDNLISTGAVDVVIPARKSKVKMVEMNVNDLQQDTFGTFDVIIFAGVLYHLRYPFWVMKSLQSCLKPGGILVIETGILASMNQLPMMFCPAGEVKGPYDPTSCTFFNITGMKCTLQSMGFVDIKLDSIIRHVGGAHERLSTDEAALDQSCERKIGRAVFSATKASKSLNEQWVDDYWDGIQSPEILRERARKGKAKAHHGKEAVVKDLTSK